jgi:hypothetical protein
MASMVTPRIYHSTAALLPDGRVLCTGSGRPKPLDGGTDYLNAEIYSPPYLFKGARPTITGAPSLAVNGATITINTPDAAGIAKVTLIGLTTTTHAFNMGQHFSSLPFTVVSGALHATLPASVTLLPSGFYMVFIVNSTGVPSISRMIQVASTATADVKQDPRSQLLDFMALSSENPATHGEARIVFTLARSDWGRLEVFDVGGRLVNVLTEGYFEAGRQQSVTWKGTDLAGAKVPNGVYWYQLRTSSVTLTGKVALLTR